MPIRVVDNRSKLKKRQSYRSQRPDNGETDRLTNRDLDTVKLTMDSSKETDRLTNRDLDYIKQATDPAFEKRRERMLAGENPSFKHGGVHKKKKMKKYSSGGMSKARGTGIAIRGTKFKGIF